MAEKCGAIWAASYFGQTKFRAPFAFHPRNKPQSGLYLAGLQEQKNRKGQ
jgi:hypothetical protein